MQVKTAATLLLSSSPLNEYIQLRMTISRHTKSGAVELARNVNEQRESDK